VKENDDAELLGLVPERIERRVEISLPLTLPPIMKPRMLSFLTP